MLANKRIELQEWSNRLINELKIVHRNFKPNIKYPRNQKFESAIYDSEGKQIFTTTQNFVADLQKVVYKEGDFIYFIREPESYYLGAKYVILQIPDDKIWLQKTMTNIGIYGFFLLFFVIIMGYFLLKLLISPMKQAIYLLDRFIKDTTHELNTPVSAILTNIELLENEPFSPKVEKKIDRIKIAAKTISNLYSDLTYALLHNKLPSNDEQIQLTSLLQERIQYFMPMAKSKKISLDFQSHHDPMLFIDRAKCTKMIDNLFSNAIKYNKLGGNITVTLEKNSLSIKDSGLGIKQEHIDKIFTRYSRFENVSGGFGIGLSIVKMIADEYGITVEVESKEGVGTTMSLHWV